MSELWIIEAPGKAHTLESLLAKLGFDAKVQATKGHFLSMPKSLSPLGIDSRLHEFLRAPRDMDLYLRVRSMAKEASRVIIATDADDEGDVIGWDVAEAVSDIHPAQVRVRLKGMDEESIREAVVDAGPVRRDDAVPGRTRAIIDRMIGAAFSANGVGVGRVRMAMLGVIARDKPTVWRLKLSAPAKDGGRPWLAECDIKEPLTRELADRLARLTFPALDMASSSSFTAPPQHMGDIMVRAADRLDMPPAETARSMQRSYESGRLSYPRAGSRGMSRSAARRVRKALEKAGFKFDAEAVKEKSEGEVHDAPHPIGAVNASFDPRKLGADEGVRAMIARGLVRTGQVHARERPGVARLEAFLIREGFQPAVAKHVAGLDWRREQGPRYPDQESWGRSEVVARRPDAVLLEAMLETGLGRPSTWATHVESFLQHGLVDEDINLTAKGEAWMAASPPELLDPRLSVAIEKACGRTFPAMFADGSREPWEALAEKIVRALPPALQQPMLAAVAAEHAWPRQDFRALAEPGIDFAALQQTHAPAYTPDT